MIDQKYIGNKERLRRENQKIVYFKRKLKNKHNKITKKDNLIMILAEMVQERSSVYRSPEEVIRDAEKVLERKN